MSEKPNRPGVVLAAAIILFVFGGCSILGVCGAIFPYVIPAAQPPNKAGNELNFVEPTPVLVKEEPVLMAVHTGFAVFDALLGIAKIWAGVGILRLRSNARIAGIVLAIFTLLLSVAQNAYTAFYFVPAYVRVFARENAPEIAQYSGVAEWISLGLAGVQVVASIGLWLTVILLLNSQRARDAFAGIAETSPIAEPEPAPRSRYAGYDDDDESYPRSPG